MTIEQQILSIVLMLVSSFITGIIFDAYRVLKGKVFFPKWSTFIIDVCFGIVSAFFTFYLLLWTNNGQLRLIIVAAFLTGLWLYYLILSKYIVLSWTYVFKIIYNIWKALIKLFNILIFKPVIMLFQLILLIFSSFVTLITMVYRFMQNFIISFSKLILKTVKRKNRDKRKKEGFFHSLKKIFKRKR